jgi:hypothetical protein
MSEQQAAPPPCEGNGNITSCGYSGVANPAAVGIIVGCVAFVLIVVLLIFCCRREHVLKSHTNEEKANLGRSSIAGLKSSIAALRTSTALNEMSNVSKGVLKRQILEQLVIKTVDTDGSSTDKKESFLQSLSKSNRAYSSFAAALSSTGSNNTTVVKFVDADAPDVEKGDITNTEEQLNNNEDEEPAAAVKSSSPPSVDRRRSNSMARSLSMKLTKKDDTSKCYLCLMAYTQGEEVAFSKNNKCKHQFHKDCIVEWLMKRTACPCCREEYIENNKL